MTRHEANNLLDILRRGEWVCESLVDTALIATGDIPGATTENAGAVAFSLIANALEVA